MLQTPRVSRLTPPLLFHSRSRGSAFVAFSSADEATRAVTEMNGKMAGTKPLYVALAQRKEDRRMRLQAGPGRCCSPRQQTHFEPSSLEFQTTL